MPKHSDDDPRQTLPRFRLDDAGQLRFDADAPRTPGRSVAQSLQHMSQVLRFQKQFTRLLNFSTTIKRLPRARPALRSWKQFLTRSLRTYRLLGAVVVLIAVVGLSVHVVQQRGQSVVASVQGAQTSAPTRGNPTFPTIIPSGKQIQTLGGWYRVSPPNRDPVYAFVDHIGKVQITVSEQPLPKSFESDTAEQISSLALGFGADQKLASDSITAYIGTSARGPQSVILTKNNLLILIKSTDVLSNDQWIAYLVALQ